MTAREPTTELDARYSSGNASAVPWSEATSHLTRAGVYWITTVRPEGRPHVTPLIAVWLDDALCFCTGPDERKAKNLAANPHCAVTTGGNDLDRGFDIVVEGDAATITDETRLQHIADTYVSKYGNDWHFDVRDGAFYSEGGRASVFAIVPTTAFGFGKGDPFSQTRWRFA